MNAKEAKRTAAVFSHVYVGSRQEKTPHKNRTPGLFLECSPRALLLRKQKQRLVCERRRRPVRHCLAGVFVRSHPTYRWVCSERVYFDCGRLAEEASGGSGIPIVNATVTRPGPVVGLARWASTRRHHRSCRARRGTNPRDAASPRRSWPTNWTPVCCHTNPHSLWSCSGPRGNSTPLDLHKAAVVALPSILVCPTSSCGV